MTSHTLILGAPGSGKSFLAACAKERGFSAYDADYDVPGLGVWKDKEGKAVSFPKIVTIDWLETHAFVWDVEVLAAFLRAHESVALFGIASNAFALSGMFDRVFYLSVSESVLRERLLHSIDRKNPRGKSEAEVQQIWHDIVHDHMPQIKEKGITCIDGDRNAEEVVVNIFH